MSDTVYIYGTNNGASYTELPDVEPRGAAPEQRTHWDPRVQVSGYADLVQVGIVPPSTEKSTDSDGVWDSDDGQFLSLDRNGVNRLIRALREARIRVYGVDE